MKKISKCIAVFLFEPKIDKLRYFCGTQGQLWGLPDEISEIFFGYSDFPILYFANHFVTDFQGCFLEESIKIRGKGKE